MRKRENVVHSLPTRLCAFLRREAVLSIALLCAALSMLAVPPDAGYAGYIDLRVLCLLFCLMAVVAGLQQCGLFQVLSQRLLSGRKQLRLLYLVLTLLPFFCSMLITNDVALLTFVPFTVLVLGRISRTEALVRVVVLQTLAANLGSMATPVGNPQNLFLCSYYTLSFRSFLSVVLLCLLLFARGLFAQVDYALLATFVCFFIFAGNMGRIEPVRGALELLMGRSSYWTSLAASQVISNVPAAVLLSGFTGNWQALLAGVNVGGLGTPIASLASLISLKLYLRAEGASLPRFLAVFAAANLAGLALLSLLAVLLGLTG